MSTLLTQETLQKSPVLHRLASLKACRCCGKIGAKETFPCLACNLDACDECRRCGQVAILSSFGVILRKVEPLLFAFDICAFCFNRAPAPSPRPFDKIQFRTFPDGKVLSVGVRKRQRSERSLVKEVDMPSE